MKKEEKKNPCEKCATGKKQPISWVCEDCRV